MCKCGVSKQTSSRTSQRRHFKYLKGIECFSDNDLLQKKGAGLLYKVLQRASENTIPLTHDWSGQSFQETLRYLSIGPCNR